MSAPPRSSRPNAVAVAVTDRRGWLSQAAVGAACVTLPQQALAASEAGPASNEALLVSLLARNQKLRPDYGGGFSNHVSMGLYSLSALGASASQLTRFADAHWPSLEPLSREAGPRLARGSWSERLGQAAALNGYLAFFADEVAREGRDATLRRYLPGLLPGIGAAAFHALIRTGYGVRFRDDGEVVAGLAYWATAFLPLGPLGPAGVERDPRALLTRVHETPTLAGLELPGRLIHGKMKSAAALPGFGAVVDALSPGDATLAAIAASTVRLYAESGDFTALHAVTGTHAYRMLEPYVEPREAGLRYLWQALVAAYVSIGAPRLVEPPAGEPPAWLDSIRAATASLDEHDIKLVDIAREQGAFYGESIYRRAAARRVRLI